MKKKTWIVAGVAVLALSGGLMIAKARGWLAFSGTVRQVSVDLARPDAWIRTQNLAQLPRDLLRIPLARDVLAEDLLYYYEQHEDKMSLRGSLRRLVYEHDLKWEDRLLDSVLAEEAEIAMWRDSRGGLRHFLLAITRNQLAKVLEEAVKLSASDSQLSKLTSIRVDGDEVNLLALRHSSNQTLVFASRGNRVVVVSDPGLLMIDEKKMDSQAKAVLVKLLGGETKGQNIYQDYFAINKSSSKHSIVFANDFLTFSYQHFFPGFEALRFDFSSSGEWQSKALFDSSKLPANSLQDKAIWRAMPNDAAACALLPVDWPMGNKVLGKLPSEKVAALLTQFDGPAAICWYAQSSLHTPLLVAHLKDGSKPDSAFVQQLFQWLIANATQASAQKLGNGQVWQAEVEAPFAVEKSNKPNAKKKKDASPAAQYRPSLAQQGQYLLFSPDAKLVELGSASIAKRYPNVADVLPQSGTSLALFTPSKLARMTQEEARQVLEVKGEEIFLGAAKEHLWPKLEMLKKYPPYRLVLPQQPAQNQRAWQEVQWQTVAKK